MTRRRAWRGAGVVLLGQGTVQLLALLRNVVLARALAPEAFGPALALALFVSLLETSTDMGVDRALLRARGEVRPAMRRAAHLLALARGAGVAGLVLLFAPALAAAFGAPHLTGALRLLALAPLLRVLVNLGQVESQRDLRTGPLARCQVLAASAGAAAAAVWATLRPDGTAVLGSLVVQMAAYAVLTHLATGTRWSVGVDRAELRALLRFGAPLLVNGLFLWAVLQGDRLLVALRYTPRDVAVFAIAASAASLPALLALRAQDSVLLPLLARVQDDPVALRARAREGALVLSAAGAALALACGLAGGRVAGLVFGEVYLATGPLLVWLGLAQGARVARTAQVATALALGDSLLPLLANVVRATGLGAAVLLALSGAPLATLAQAAAAGELLALASGVLLLRARHGERFAPAPAGALGEATP